LLKKSTSMKFSKSLLAIVFITTITILFVIAIENVGYEKNYGFYYTKQFNVDQKVTSYSYMVENFNIQIINADVGFENENYYLEFNGIVKNKSKHFLNELMIISDLYVELDGNYVDLDFEHFQILKYDEKLNANQSIKFSKKLYFQKFNPDFLNYKVIKATLEVTLNGSNSVGYKISDNANVVYYHSDYDLTESWKAISK
jgi:hypothetical protein